jgi:hypothetical protein
MFQLNTRSITKKIKPGIEKKLYIFFYLMALQQALTRTFNTLVKEYIEGTTRRCHTFYGTCELSTHTPPPFEHWAVLNVATKGGTARVLLGGNVFYDSQEDGPDLCYPFFPTLAKYYSFRVIASDLQVATTVVEIEAFPSGPTTPLIHSPILRRKYLVYGSYMASWCRHFELCEDHDKTKANKEKYLPATVYTLALYFCKKGDAEFLAHGMPQGAELIKQLFAFTLSIQHQNQDKWQTLLATLPNPHRRVDVWHYSVYEMLCMGLFFAVDDLCCPAVTLADFFDRLICLLNHPNFKPEHETNEPIPLVLYCRILQLCPHVMPRAHIPVMERMFKRQLADCLSGVQPWLFQYVDPLTHQCIWQTLLAAQRCILLLPFELWGVIFTQFPAQHPFSPLTPAELGY